jgi:hypothetical protein
MRLTVEVLFRLPEGWDDERTWSVTTGRKQSPKGYAYVLREEEGEGETEQLWSMTLLPSLLDKLSDSAVHWVIAHEFGHIASGLPTGSLGIEGTAHTRVKGTVDRYEPAPEKAIHEDAADSIALSWGFSEELHAFLLGLRTYRLPPTRENLRPRPPHRLRVLSPLAQAAEV